MIRGTGIDSTVKLYLKGNGANGSTKFFDDSQSHHTMIPTGDVEISTTSSKFGGSSMHFGGNGDYISMSSPTDLNFLHQVGTSGRWSIGCFVLFSADGRNHSIIDTSGGQSAYSGMYCFVNTSNVIIVVITRSVPSSYVVSSHVYTWNYEINTWYYLLLNYDQSLSTDNLKIYIDGVNIHSETKTGNAPTTVDNYCATVGSVDVRYPEFSPYGYFDDMYVSDKLNPNPTKIPTRQRG